ncbi:MAG TPA: hypothetical protein VII92_03850 [Anaerolineae bacterium]
MSNLSKDKLAMNSPLPGEFLNIPVPPQLEAAVEYHGEARFFAIFWQAAGDEAMVSDGRVTHDGCWWGYQAFVDHPLIAIALAGHRYNLGSSESTATHWLVIDRQTRTASIALVQEAERFLGAQHPPLPQIDLTSEQWRAIVDQLNQAMGEQLKTMMAQIETFDPYEAIARQNIVVAEMRQWLDARLPADWREQLRQQLLRDLETSDPNFQEGYARSQDQARLN